MVGGMYFTYADHLHLHLHCADSNIYRHIMTGVGAYLYIIWGIWLRHCLNNRQDEYHLRWARFWHIPEVIRTSPVSENEVARDKKFT